MYNKFVIYGLQDPFTKEIRYIGKSCSGYRRIKRHFSRYELEHDSNRHKVNWIKSIQAQGMNPLILIIQELFSHEQVAKAEIHWIGYFKNIGCPLVNLTEGGESTKLVEETKLKLRQSTINLFKDDEFRKKHKAGMLKTAATIEEKKRKSKATKRLWESQDYRNTISQKRKEAWAKDGYKERLGKSISRGRCVKVIDCDGIIYESMMDAAEKNKTSRSSITNCVKGKQKTAAGKTFRRYE